MSAPARTELTDFLESWRPRIERELDRVLPREDEDPANLHRALRYAVFGGGKRLRPSCCLLAAAAAGGDPAQALGPACALELVHTYSLVHDDLPCMDDDDLRRGRPTVHRAFDEATAVLAGDALLTLAFEAAIAGSAPDRAVRIVRSLAAAAGSLGMVGGQAADLEAEGVALAEGAILAIDRRKTAALFAAAFECGAIAAGADDATAHRLAEAGRDLGIAFQVVDDLLDLHATPEQLGKATGKDRGRGKATLPALLGPERAFAEAERLSQRASAAVRALPAGRLIDLLIGTMLHRSH